MKRLFTYVSSVTLLLALIGNVVPASAQSTGSSGLSITPRKNLTLKPGESTTDKLTIGNLSKNADLEVSLKAIDFTFMNETGTPKLLLGENTQQTAWSVRPFLEFTQSVVVPAGQSRTVNYTLTIPKNQGAGSYYSAIQYGTGGTNGGNVNLSASGVTLVFVSVPGVVKEDMTLKRFGAYQLNKDNITGSYVKIATNKPEQVAFTLQNNGNVAEAPVGSVTVKYMFGKKQWNIDNVNETSSLALIGQSRIYLNCLESQEQQVNVAGSEAKNKTCKSPKLWPGRYTATLDAFYGQNGNNTHQVSATASFWYLPWWFLITIIALLTIISTAVLLIVYKAKRAARGKSARRR